MSTTVKVIKHFILLQYKKQIYGTNACSCMRRWSHWKHDNKALIVTSNPRSHISGVFFLSTLSFWCIKQFFLSSLNSRVLVLNTSFQIIVLFLFSDCIGQFLPNDFFFFLILLCTWLLHSKFVLSQDNIIEPQCINSLEVCKNANVVVWAFSLPKWNDISSM